MSHLQYFAYDGFGQMAKQKLWYSQAVRVGDKIEIAGQGGWDRQSQAISENLEQEIAQAFDNVEHNLKTAGGSGWDQVYLIRSYHVGMDAKVITELMVQKLKEHCPNHQPVWTLLGVEKLGLPEMRIEIDVVAHIPSKP